jgi:putative hydroxymethylpyrimidine transport system permease protein
VSAKPVPGGEARRPPRAGALGTAAKYGPAAVLVVAAIGLWELLIRALDVADYIWPAPSLIATTFRADAHLLASSTWVTLREIVLGFLIALAAGLGFGIALHLSATLKRAVYPLLIASQSVPTVVLAPVLVIAMGFSIGPKLVIIGLFCFFPIVVNCVDGLAAVDREYIRMMLTLDASRFAIFRRVEFPAALPLIFSGARIAATYAAIGAVFGEWAGSEAGLGYEMQSATGQLQTPRVFAIVIILTVMAVLLFLLVSLVERLTIPWARGGGAME